MYNLLTGTIPTESILRAARPLRNPSEINAAISPKTEAVIIKAMQIIPADRFETVGEVLASLDLLLFFSSGKGSSGCPKSISRDCE